MPTNQNFSYKNEYYNESNSSRTYYPERDIPPPPIKTTTSYLNESNNTINRTGPSVPMNPENLGPNQSYFYKKEVNETTNNASDFSKFHAIFMRFAFELANGNIYFMRAGLWSTKAYPNCK